MYLFFTLLTLHIAYFQVEYRKQLIQEAASTINIDQLDIWS